jgi:hypothetical protein
MKKLIKILILAAVLVGFTAPHGDMILAINDGIRGTPNHRSAHSQHVTQSESADLEWVFECVDCPKIFYEGADRNLRLDQDGNPHIVYGGNHLYYAWFDGTAWHYETVDPSQGVGGYASLALDAQDYPHISYRSDYPDMDLRYAVLDSEDWHIQTIDHNIGDPTSISVDQLGSPHIIYVQNYALKYAYQESDNWQILTLDSECCTGGSASVISNHEGYPHISYIKNNNLIYTYQDESGWHTSLVDRTPEGYLSHASLTLDKQGYPHISYYDDYAGILKYAYLVAPFWQFEFIEAANVLSTSIAKDGQGVIHVSYKTHEELRLATRDTSGWQSEQVAKYNFDPISDNFLTSSLALDDENQAHILYMESNELKYASQEDYTWKIGVVDHSGAAGWGNSIVLDDDGHPHVSYLSTGAVMYAYKDQHGWHREVIDSYNFIPNWNPTSLALDRQGNPHISYSYLQNNARIYAYRTATGWQREVVDYAVDPEGDMVLDENDNPHIVYNQEVFGPEGYQKGLLHAYKDGEFWQTEWLSSEFGHEISLAWFAGELYTSYTKPNTWGLVVENLLVDAEGALGTSLVVDKNGKAHISYTANSNIDYFHTRYAHQITADGWEIMTVQNNTDYYTSLALDENGYPHISYVPDGLFYAYQDANGWDYHQVDSNGHQYNSIALDKDSLPHLTYQNISGELMYANIDNQEQVEIRPAEAAVYSLPGSTIATSFQITNHTQISDTYRISVSNHIWSLTNPDAVGPLESDQSIPVVFHVTIPPTTTLGSSDTTTITLTSQSDPSVTATAKLTTYAAITTYLPLVSR